MGAGKKDIIPVDIQRNLHKKIKKEADSRGMSIRKFTNELVKEWFNAMATRSKIYPHLYDRGIDDGKMFIQDNETNRAYVVTRENLVFKCSCDSNDTACEHILFAFGSPEMDKML